MSLRSALARGAQCSRRNTLLGVRCASSSHSSPSTSSSTTLSSSVPTPTSSSRHLHDSPATRPQHPTSPSLPGHKKPRPRKPRNGFEPTRDTNKYYPMDPEEVEADEALLLPRIEKLVGSKPTRLALREAALASKGVEGEPHLPHPIRADTAAAMKAVLRMEARQTTDLAQVRKGELSVAIEAEEEDEAVGLSFAPGTFVETRKNEQSVQGIVLDEVVEDRKWTVFSLNSHGEVFGHSRADVHFAVPNFISADHAERCGTLFITSTPSQIAARVEALKQLRLMSKKSQSEAMGTKSWEMQRAVNIYDRVKHGDPTRWATTTVEEVTHLFYTQPSFVDYYTTHKYLMDNSLHYVAARNYLKTQRFAVRPERDVREIKEVLMYITEYRDGTRVNGPFRRFFRKAKRVLREYERLEEEGKRRDRGPVGVEPMEVQWSEEDQLFLRFLLRSCQPTQSNQCDPFTAGRNAIMKLLVPRGPPLQDNIVAGTVMKLGIIAPWQNLYELTPKFNPVGDFTVRNSLADEDRAIVDRTVGYTAKAGAVLGPEDLRPADPLEGVRHDFGDLTVFVIDAMSAEELDDGVSLEHIPGEPDAFWVHAHIADPASVLHPGHVLCMRARERASTFYFGSQSFPLFPKELIHHPKLGMSLGDRSKTGLGDRTITLSMKVDMQGNFLDYKARAGLVHKIRKVTYHDVDRVLGIPPRNTHYPFGGPQEPPEHTTTFTEDETTDLRILKRLMDAQTKRRVANGAITFAAETPRIDWKERPDIQTPCMTGAIFHGFPEMRYAVTSSVDEEHGAHGMVAETMKLACRAVSRLGTDHGVPLMRRVMDPWVAASEESHQALLDARTPNGIVSLFSNLHHILINTASAVSLLPKGHASLGVKDGEGYVRATSPLRRYEDLVAHWQLHHILQGDKAPARPPFDVADMEKFAVDAVTQDRTVRQLHNADNTYFALVRIQQYLEDMKRGVARPEGNILEGLKAFNTMNLKRNMIENVNHTFVHIPYLGMIAHLVDLTMDFAQVRLSTELRVKVKDVELGIKRPRLLVTLDDKGS
ncbi:unnamed protein product [Cyclocybe aegerita]|uniref:RNB domain-containing protein n=1 Tax=Cyclocybe aegerita TaxID=1973307 RepID=A0A8S0XWH0_CYCAE|nr:unnamed protein product [Cyclocybe aegerita]